MDERKEWITDLGKAMEELKNNQTILVTRGDLFGEEEVTLYKFAIRELTETKSYLKGGGDVEKAYRFLQQNVFMRHESFFMDLFETRQFPQLFDLFEKEPGGKSC